MRSNSCAFLAVLLCGSAPASAQFIAVHGGPTYTSGVGGFQVQLNLNWDAQTGLFDGMYGAGTALKYDAAGLNLGRRPLRFQWDGASSQMQVTELDILGTGPGGAASGVNRAGNVVGWAGKNDGAGDYKGIRAVRWEPSGTAVTELGYLGTDALGVTQSVATAINSAGVAIGWADKYDAAGVFQGLRAVRWEPSGTVATELGHLGTDAVGVTRSSVSAINSAGVIIGYADRYDTAGVFQGRRAVRWEPSGTVATELELFGTDKQSVVSGINSAGVAVGYAETFDDYQRALRWDASGAATELDIPNEAPFELGYPWRQAVAINDAGMVVGRVHGDFYTLSVRWDASGNPTELEDLGMRGGAWVEDINNAGIAVGIGGEPGMSSYVYSAVYWGLDGVAVDLNSLIDPASGWTLKRAFDISDSGWITGIGLFDPDGPGGQEAYQRQFFIQFPEFSAGLAGDFNQNDIVDAADYVLWRKLLGSGTSLPNDDTPGVGQDDYTRWRSNFGQQAAGSGAAANLNATVPEPSSLALLVLAILARLRRHQRRYRLRDE